MLRRRFSAPWRSRSLARLGAGGSGQLAASRGRIGADLIHTNMEVVLDGAIAARWLGLPHVLHYRGNSLDQPRQVFDLLTWTWTGLSDQVFCISDTTAGIFAGGPKREGVDAVQSSRYRGVRPSIAVVRGAGHLGARDGDTLVGTVGRIHPRKDLETFVRAAALVARDRPRVRFVVVGAAEGPAEEAYLEQLRTTARPLGLGQHLLFAAARRDMPATFKAFDIFVLAHATRDSDESSPRRWPPVSPRWSRERAHCPSWSPKKRTAVRNPGGP